MWTLISPVRGVGSVLAACVQGIPDPQTRSAFENTATLLIEAEDRFRTAASNNMVCEIPSTSMVGSLTVKEMTWLYTKKMADARAPGRAIYDEIKMSAPNGRCPLCGRGIVTTLDHYLPKAYYPDLALTPINLIPACQDCNKNKGTAAPTMPIEETLHPYFDDIEGEMWLKGRVVEASPAAVVFAVAAPTIWSSTLAMRVRHHFRVYKLSSLYTSLAAEEISNIRTVLGKIEARRGVEGVAEYLQAVAGSHRTTRLNTWQAAAYSAMSSSDWFCGGGYSLRG